MSQMKKFTHKNEHTIKIVIDRNGCFLALRLNCDGFFYPWLTYGPYDEYDHACAEDDYISKEQFEKDKNKSVKIHKMYKDEKYKELFENKFRENIEAFLRQIEYEVEIEYEEFLARGASIPESSWNIKKSLLDKYLSDNEDAIFEFLKEKGLYFLRNRTILSTIERWCDERNNEKLEKFAKTLKKIAKVKPGRRPIDVEEVFIISWDPYLRNKIKEIQDKIKLYDKEIRRDDTIGRKLISEYKEKPVAWWFKYLEEIAKETQGKIETNLVEYLRSTPRREISIEIFAKKYKVKGRKIEEIFRERKKIAEELKVTLTDLVEKFNDFEYWGGVFMIISVISSKKE